jgi:hypothetical protein
MFQITFINLLCDIVLVILNITTDLLASVQRAITAYRTNHPIPQQLAILQADRSALLAQQDTISRQIEDLETEIQRLQTTSQDLFTSQQQHTPPRPR